MRKRNRAKEYEALAKLAHEYQKMDSETQRRFGQLVNGEPTPPPVSVDKWQAIGHFVIQLLELVERACCHFWR